MCSGPVPQHPPSRRAPAATHEAATVARSAGDITSTKFQFGLVKYPDSGYTPIGPDHRCPHQFDGLGNGFDLAVHDVDHGRSHRDESVQHS
jgi:hypothetical protein